MVSSVLLFSVSKPFVSDNIYFIDSSLVSCLQFTTLLTKEHIVSLQWITD